MSSLFLDQFLRSNPFDDNRVTTIDGLNGDVPEINDRPFAALCMHAEKAAPGRKGRGVLVSGSPGIGKSHLLARFGQWARSEKYPFVYLLNLQAGPNDLLRSILRATIGVLSRDYSTSPSQSRIYRLISCGVRRAVELRHGRFDASTCTRRVAHQALMEMMQRQNIDPAITAALWAVFDFVQCRRLRIASDFQSAKLAISWLSGDTVDVAEAKRFGGRTTSSSEDGCQLNLEDMKDVLRALCLLAETRGRCLILCFDQVDTLSEDQVQSWSASVHALLDLCPSLLVITSGVDETFLRWTSRGLVSTASWDDRIRQFPVLLSGITSQQARVMLDRRIENWFREVECSSDIIEARRADRYFPVGTTSVDALLKETDGSDRNDLRPRDVISRIGAVWERHAAAIRRDGLSTWLQHWQASTTSTLSAMKRHLDQETPPTAELLRSTEATIEKKLADQIRQRLTHQRSISADPAHVIGLIRGSLSACLRAEEPWRNDQYRNLHGLSLPGTQSRPRPTFALMVEQKRESSGEIIRTGVAYCDVTTGNAATNLMKRLKDELQNNTKLHRIVLIEDETRPLELARTGSAVLEFLERDSSRFLRIRMTTASFAALDALETIAGQARSGDLSAIGEDGTLTTIGEDEVRSHFHQRRKYRDSPLLQPFFTVTPAAPEPLNPAVSDDSGISLDVISAEG